MCFRTIRCKKQKWRKMRKRKISCVTSPTTFGNFSVQELDYKSTWDTQLQGERSFSISVLFCYLFWTLAAVQYNSFKTIGSRQFWFQPLTLVITLMLLLWFIFRSIQFQFAVLLFILIPFIPLFQVVPRNNILIPFYTFASWIPGAFSSIGIEYLRSKVQEN